MARRPTEEDRVEAIQELLSGLENGSDAHELAAAVADLHPKNNTFPGEVFMELAADAFDLAEISRDTSILYEGLLETHLPECQFRGRDNRKIQYAILSPAQPFALVLGPTCWMRSSGGRPTTTGDTLCSPPLG